MSCTETLKAHVSPDVKRQARAVADREFLSEAAWLKRLVLREIRACEAANDGGMFLRPFGQTCGFREGIELLHRNALLGRASTVDEIAFLREPGSRF